jgi:hypothetical protein
VASPEHAQRPAILAGGAILVTTPGSPRNAPTSDTILNLGENPESGYCTVRMIVELELKDGEETGGTRGCGESWEGT